MSVAAALLAAFGTGSDLAFAGWSPQASGTIELLHSVHFRAGASPGYVVGAGGTILKTTNGGANWLPQTPGTTNQLLSVHFPVDSSTGYIVGGNGIILKTTNGGAAWAAQTSGTIQGFTAVHFPADASTGYAVGLSGTILKTVDGGGATAETVWITNPTSGINLYCHIHRPADFDPGSVYPGVILCPGGNGTGTSFDGNGTAQGYADLGFIVMHFDPDGRGQSTNGGAYTTEDYCGYLQQDGAHAVLQYLVDLPETDDLNIGIVTSSYGITMGAGVVGRYLYDPTVKFMMDGEGPADRTDTAQPNGHVPHSTADDSWWYEREPTNFIDDWTGYYLRVQSQVDHAQPDNDHAIKLVNPATDTLYGGAGRCAWTRVNSETGDTTNPPNTVYVYPTSQPQYLVETVSLSLIQRQYLQELAAMPPLPTGVSVDPGGAPPAAGRSWRCRGTGARRRAS